MRLASRVLVLPLGITTALLFAPATGAAPAADSGTGDESAETALEQALARAAELAAHAERAPLPIPFAGSGLTRGTDGPLFVGVDDATVPAYRIEVAGGGATQAFTGFELWGAAYDPAGDRVFFNSGSTLRVWPVGGAVETLGIVVDGGGAAQAMVGLAFDDGVLYGVKNIANEAIWSIDPTTLVATVLVDYVDADFDFGGFAVDPASGEFYATNDDTSPHGSGLFRIALDGTGTLVAPYPAGQTDLDGLAVGGGFAYLVPDEPGSIYVWDLVAGAYVAPLPNPWTTLEVFSAGAWIELPGPAPDIEVDPLVLSHTQPADTQTTLPLDVSNVGAAPLVWTLYEAPFGESTCGGPGEIPWLSASPLGGTTPPGETDTVDVTFDSTGLAPGLYTGSLCVESDDPLEPLVQVPVTLTVDTMPFLDGFESGDTARWSSTVP